MLKIFKKYKLGLVLSGGAARGFAHLGVFKAMEEIGIEPDIISGVSAGSIAGAFYADGFSAEEALEIMRTKKIFELMRLVLPRTGFLKLAGLKSILEKNLRCKRIEDLKKPLIVGATNFLEGKIEYFDKGNLVECLLASSCIPVLFQIQTIKKVPYIDGGVMDNLPIYPVENNCKKIIAVHVNPLGKVDKAYSPIHVAERTFHLAVAADINRKKKLVDVFIEPHSLVKYGLLDTRKADEIFNIGYDAAMHVFNSKGKEILISEAG